MTFAIWSVPRTAHADDARHAERPRQDRTVRQRTAAFDHEGGQTAFGETVQFRRFDVVGNDHGVVERIKAPFLITHGANDRQINVKYAQQSYDAATASIKRELRIFDEPEGGTEHISIDHMPYVAGYIADWVAETFAEMK